MARPGILRADTLDLQDHEAPSAKNHPHPHPQPHNGQQQQDDVWGSGRSSHEGSELLEEDADFLTDGGTVPMDLRGGHDQSGTNRSSEDSDMTDGDEDGTDDDLVDKISSSPSIGDDGEYNSLYTFRRTFNPAFSPDDSPFSVTNFQDKIQVCPDKKTITQDKMVIREKTLRGKGIASAPNSTCASPKPRSSRPPSPTLQFNDEGQIDATRSPSRLRTFIEGIKAKYTDAAGTVPSMPSQFSLGSVSLSSEGAYDEDETMTQEDEMEYSKDPENIMGNFCEDSVTESLPQQLEDIDFEFVYALHTFVATVEGQANATKGDTMVLLDDSNSYWWLVRVVKDSSIGYLPAEHIETPTERLARLNKHRNADVGNLKHPSYLHNANEPQLAQQMLTDSSEKSKNPLKKAMRRRNAKMVQFTAPTYYEASENEWSDDEEQDGDMDVDSRSNGDTQQNGDSSTTADTVAASSSGTGSSSSNDVSAEPTAEQQKEGVQANAEQNPSADAAAQERGLRIDPDQANREAFDGKDAPSISKNGNIRNTDSFFKDDTAEPKKMSLTPTLLRDSENATADSPRTSEQVEPSPISDTFEQLDKSTSPTSDKFKEDKKKKEKKPGMLSGLFKRKDKKIKVDEAAGGTVRSSKDGETLLGSPTSSPGESTVATPAPERAPQPSRKSSGNKLVKSPPQSAISTSNSTAAASSTTLGLSTPSNGALKPAPLSPNLSAGGTSPLSQTSSEQQRSLAPSSAEIVNGKPTGLRVQTGGSPTEKKEGGLLSPLSNLLPQSDQPKKEKLKKAKQRMDLDVDSSPERESSSPLGNSRNAFQTSSSRHAVSNDRSETSGDGLVSPVDKHPPSFDSLGNPRSHSPVSRSPTPTETASTVQTPQSEPEPKTSTAASSTVPPDHHPTVSEESTDTQWDDVALRNYLDERGHDDVRDLLIRVHDRSEVVPLPDNHPTMIELGFHETQAQLDAMFTQLDGMLYSFLDRVAARHAARQAAAASATAA